MGMDDEWRTTKSGYRYPRIKVDELLPEDGEPFAWTCGEKNCGVIVQGGWKAVDDHRKTVHPEVYGLGLA